MDPIWSKCFSVSNKIESQISILYGIVKWIQTGEEKSASGMDNGQQKNQNNILGEFAAKEH